MSFMNEDIHIEKLKFAYDQGRPILNIDQLTINHDHLTILYGRSGSGKSTLLKILAGFLPDEGGKLSGKINLPSQTRITMMFQDPSLQFALDTPRHEIEFALENLQVPADKIEDQVTQTLSQAGITQLADRQFASLSGGEQQLAALAVIIAMDADLLLLDEPFASLDHHHRDLLLQKLRQLQAQGKTIIIADHDLNGYEDLQADIIDFNHGIQQLNNNARQQLFAQQEVSNHLQVSLPSPNNQQAAIKLTDFSLERPDHLLIRQNDQIIYRGKTTLITGESGSGKSSFFKALTRLLPFGGQVRLFNHQLDSLSAKQLGRTVGLVFQRAADQFLNVTVAEELALSQRQGRSNFFSNEQVHRALQDLGLANMYDRVVYSLSGGQQKKLQLLLMLMMGQPLILLDEPFSGLDPASIKVAGQLIRQCQRHSGLTVLLISHQLNGIEPYIDYQLQLKDHQLKYRGGGHHES